jgi:PPOX class probable F420-dependent enzyme
VWFSRDGGDVLVNTMREFQKARNLRVRPRATLLVLDSPTAERWVEVRGTVTMEEAGASEHLNALARAYARADRYFGEVVPADLAAAEHPVVCRIHPAEVIVGPSTTPAAAAAAPALPVTPPPRGHPFEEPALPASHRDLLDGPHLAALSTRLRSGAQTHPAWFEADGNDVLVNTTLERSKGRNLLRDPRATILVVDPANTSRWIEVRGAVDLELEGALDQLDRLTRRYTSHPRFYGRVYPLDRRDLETRVIARIHPRRITCDAIHR